MKDIFCICHSNTKKSFEYHAHVTFFLQFCWCTHVFSLFQPSGSCKFFGFEYYTSNSNSKDGASRHHHRAVARRIFKTFFVEFGKRITKRSFRLSLWNPKFPDFARLAALVDFVKDIASKWCEAHEESPNYGNLLDFETFNFYHATFWVNKPATLDYWREGCSYVELVAISMDDQRPKWFVSHAWLEPIVRFMRCLKQHALVRQLSPRSAYWVCASKKTRDDRPQLKFWCVLVVYFLFFLFGKVLSVGPPNWTWLTGLPLCREGETYLKSNRNPTSTNSDNASRMKSFSKSDQRCICE